jgi:hypothetical protein
LLTFPEWAALWGAIESKALNLDGRRAYRFRLGVTTEQLTEILWRGADWPSGWGMYVLYDRDQDEPVKQNSIRIRLASMGSEVLGGFIQIAGFEFLIGFETPPSQAVLSAGRFVIYPSWLPSSLLKTCRICIAGIKTRNYSRCQSSTAERRFHCAAERTCCQTSESNLSRFIEHH